MDGIDSSTWQALGLALTVVGVLLSVLLWRRRGAASGLRGFAWALLPAAAGLTGTLRLLYEIGDAVVGWAARLVFSPIVWSGIVLAGVSVVLFGVSGAMRARSVGGAAKRPAAESGEKKRLPQERTSRKAEPAVKDEDMDDIEAILRKHGIQ